MENYNDFKEKIRDKTEARLNSRLGKSKFTWGKLIVLAAGAYAMYGVMKFIFMFL